MRTRSEAARLAKINDSGVSTALDDSLLVLTAYEGHSIEDLAGASRNSHFDLPIEDVDGWEVRIDL